MVGQPGFGDDRRKTRERPHRSIPSPAPGPPPREPRQREEDRRARERFESEGGNQKQGGPPHQSRDS